MQKIFQISKRRFQLEQNQFRLNVAAANHSDLTEEGQYILKRQQQMTVFEMEKELSQVQQSQRSDT
jgi:hypothetical protein